MDHSFTGQNQDLVSNFLYDFPAREYHPGEGRWLSPDPAGLAAVDLTNPQSWNRYAYVNNSPLNSVDPLGLANVVDCTPGKYQNRLCDAHVQESVLHLGAEADRGVYGAAMFWGNLWGGQTITLWSPTQYTAPEGFTVTIVGGSTDSWEDPGSTSETTLDYSDPVQVWDRPLPTPTATPVPRRPAPTPLPETVTQTPGTGDHFAQWRAYATCFFSSLASHYISNPKVPLISAATYTSKYWTGPVGQVIGAGTATVDFISSENQAAVSCSQLTGVIPLALSHP